MWWLTCTSLAIADEPDPEPRGWVDGKPGSGITLHAPGDAASLTIRSRFQVRATAVIPADGQAAFSEILVRRARITLAGHAFDPHLRYQLSFGLAFREHEKDAPRPLMDAYLHWEATRDVQVRVGQAFVPYSRQRNNSSGSMELVDRSIVVGELNLDRDVGVQLRSDDLAGLGGRLTYAVGCFGGEGRNRPGNIAGALVAGRVSVRPMGAFSDLTEADLDFYETPKLGIGVSAASNTNTNRAESTGGAAFEGATFDYLHGGADVMMKWAGSSVQGEVLYRRAGEDSVTDSETGERVYSRSAWGWFAQGSRMLTPRVGLAARYGRLYPFAGTDPNLLEAQELGGGVSYYVHRHALKVQVDYFYLAGATFRGGEHQLRSEVQIII
jgi:phosphate-selective porin OprO and OprP